MRLNADGLASRVWSDWGAVCLAALSPFKKGSVGEVALQARNPLLMRTPAFHQNCSKR